MAQLPDAPQPQPKPGPKTWEEFKSKPAGFFTYRATWQNPPLRSARQILKSPVFLLSQAALWGSMIVACRNRRSGESFHSEAGAVAGITAFSFLYDRYFTEAGVPAIAAYGAQHYLRADLQ